MKKILIVEKELDLDGKGIVKKKNKTIIKNQEYFNDHFINSLKEMNLKYRWFIEEWEIKSKEKIQLICTNNGQPLTPVHIMVDLFPKNGVKALFQSEKMIILSLNNGIYNLSKYIIDDKGEIDINIIKVGSYLSFNDLKKDLGANFHCMLDSLINNYDKFNEEGYLAPFWAIL